MTVSAADVWKPEPRRVPEALEAGFEAAPYDPTIPFEHDHIRDWASFVELAGPEGMAALAKAVV